MAATYRNLNPYAAQTQKKHWMQRNPLELIARGLGSVVQAYGDTAGQPSGGFSPDAHQGVTESIGLNTPNIPAMAAAAGAGRAAGRVGSRRQPEASPGVAAQQSATPGGPFMRSALSNLFGATGVPGLVSGLYNEYGDDVVGAFNQARDFIGSRVPQQREVEPVSTAVDHGIPTRAFPKQRRLFGPPGPSAADFGNAMNRGLAMGHLANFMGTGQRIANQLNRSFDRSADRNLILNNQRLQEAQMRRELALQEKALDMRDKHNQRLVDAIREVLGGGGGTSAGPIPPGAVQSANAALRNVRPDMGDPYLSNLMRANIAMRAPDIEQTLVPANRSLGLAMDRQRIANAAPFLGLMR